MTSTPPTPETDELSAKLRGLLDELRQWQRAYPLDMFPEPDLEMAAEILADHGMALGSISASSMRHVVEKIVPPVLDAIDTLLARQAEAVKDARTILATELRAAGPSWVDLASAIEGGTNFENDTLNVNAALRAVTIALQSTAGARNVIEQMVSGCNAVLGLIQLIVGRDDLPAELRLALIGNHRVNEANAALRAASSWLKSVKGEG